MARTEPRELSAHWRGHVFRFGTKTSPTYDPSAGFRLLLIVLLLEGVIGPRLSLFSLLGLPVPPSWLRVPLLLSSALLLVRFVAGLALSQIGPYRWREWSRIEKSYFVQTFVIANVVFGVLFADRWRAILAEPSLWGHVGLLLATSFLWGFYQEVVYRGILQTELVRRMGSVGGILVGNFLHLRSLTLLPFFQHLVGSSDVRGHFRDRPVLCGVIPKVGQFVDGRYFSRPWRFVY